MIEVLKGERPTYSEKKKIYSDLSELLKSHAKSEEKAVYEASIRIRDLKVETYEAYEEHAVASLLDG